MSSFSCDRGRILFLNSIKMHWDVLKNLWRTIENPWPPYTSDKSNNLHHNQMNVTATSIVCACFGTFWPVETLACLYHMHPCAKRQTCEFSISGNVFTSNKTASQCQLQNITIFAVIFNASALWTHASKCAKISQGSHHCLPFSSTKIRGKRVPVARMSFF